MKTTVMIKDLLIDKVLDRNAMRAVVGGIGMGMDMGSAGPTAPTTSSAPSAPTTPTDSWGPTTSSGVPNSGPDFPWSMPGTRPLYNPQAILNIGLDVLYARIGTGFGFPR